MTDTTARTAAPAAPAPGETDLAAVQELADARRLLLGEIEKLTKQKFDVQPLRPMSKGARNQSRRQQGGRAPQAVGDVHIPRRHGLGLLGARRELGVGEGDVSGEGPVKKPQTALQN